MRNGTGILSFIAFGLLIVMLGTALSAELPDDLAAAMVMIEDGQPEQALEVALAYLDAYPGDEFNAAANLIAGRCEVALGQNSDAVHRAWEVLHAYPESPLIPEAWYLLATAYQGRGDYYEAARSLVRCLDSGATGNVAQMAEERLSGLADGVVAYRLETLREMAESEASRLVLNMLRPPMGSTPHLGVLYCGPDEDSTGTAFIEGVRAAVNKYNEDHFMVAELDIRNAVPDEVDAVLAVREMIRERDSWGVIATGSEGTAVAVAVEAQAYGVPVILPGLRRPGLFAVGPSVIQPEADWYREGELAAICAADSLGLRTFAVVAPATDRCRENVAGFIGALEQRDSTEVLSLEWYFPREGLSLSRQFLRIRDIAFRRAFADSLRMSANPDSLPLDSLLQDSVTFEKMWLAHLDSVRFSPAYKSGSIDSNSIELSNIDAFYFPIEKGTIELFAPQFAFYDFRTQRLGNSAWYNPEELYRHRQYVEDLIFTSPYVLDDTTAEYRDFANSFGDAGTDGSAAWRIRGYDAARLLLTPAAGGMVGSSETADALRGLDTLETVSGMQTLDLERHNGQRMWLLKVLDGKVVKEDLAQRFLLLNRGGQAGDSTRGTVSEENVPSSETPRGNNE